jgi:hypothetical protein
LASAVILVVMIAAITLGPTLWPVAINDIDFTARLKGPSWSHPFGTDDLGQDLLARMLYGGRISLAVGLAAMAVAIVVGTMIGAIAGMSRGWVGSALMWLTDLFLSLPPLPLLLLVIYLFRDFLKGLFGPEGGVFILIVAVIGGLRWMPVAARERVRRSRPGAGRFEVASGGASYLAQCLGAGDRRWYHRCGGRHHRRIDLVVLGPGLPARYSNLGPHPVRRQGLPRHRPALGDVPGRCYLPRRVEHQFHR